MGIGGPTTNRNTSSDKGKSRVDPKVKGKRPADPRDVEPRNFTKLVEKPKRVIKPKVVKGEDFFRISARRLLLMKFQSLGKKYNIPPHIDILAPGPSDRMYNPPPGCICVHFKSLEHGLRIPFN